MENKNMTYTDEERLQRIYDREEIEQLSALRFYFQSNEDRAFEIDEFWVHEEANRKTAAYGKNWGWYVGIDNIREYYVNRHEEHLKACLKEYSDASIVPFDSENLGFGRMSVSPYIAPAIQISGDGKTAKGLWYSIGVVCQGHPGAATEARWLCTKIAIDFIREGEKFKIWHVCEVEDSYFPIGTNYSDTPDIFSPGQEEWEQEFGTPDIQILTHDKILCWTDDYPWMPEPYYTMTPELSYGPEGWPHVKKEVFPL